jgi:hypothetical protein
MTSLQEHRLKWRHFLPTDFCWCQNTGMTLTVAEITQRLWSISGVLTGKQ